MCQKESWGAFVATKEAHSTQRGQPPRMHGPGLWRYDQKEQRVTSGSEQNDRHILDQLNRHRLDQCMSSEVTGCLCACIHASMCSLSGCLVGQSLSKSAAVHASITRVCVCVCVCRCACVCVVCMCV